MKLVTGDISQEEEEEEDDSEDSEDEDDASYQSLPLFEILADSAGATIDRLYRLAFKIRNPSMRLGSSRALEYREVDQSTGIDLMKQFAALDERYMQDLLHSYSDSHADNHYLIPVLQRRIPGEDSSSGTGGSGETHLNVCQQQNLLMSTTINVQCRWQRNDRICWFLARSRLS